MTTSISSLTVQDLLENAAWTRRLAASLLDDRDAADDVVQETWIAALHARPDARGSVRPWLARVLRNRAATHRRDHARRVAHHDRAAGLVEEASNPEGLFSRLQVQRVLAELISGLPDPARQTVLLRYYEGLNSEQIGTVMQVAPGTVRRRLKEAIDELRDQLDRHHQGNRDSWRLALLPLGAPVARAAGLPTLAIGASILGLVAGGVWLARGAFDQPPSGQGPPASAPAGNGRGGGAWLAAALPGTFDSCRQDLATRRRELAAAEIVYLGRAPKDVLFEEGAPNPTARAALLPELERIMRDDPSVTFSLECRTWACRLLLVERGTRRGRGGPAVMSEIPKDEGIKQRIRGWWYLPGNSTRDSISGDTYTEWPVHLALKTRSGAAVAGPPPALEPRAAARSEPGTLQACQSELRATGERLAYVRRVNAGEMSVAERFRESEYNPVLTVDMLSVVARALRDTGVTPDVVCRGEACRLSLPDNIRSDSWRHLLERDPAFTGRISETTVTPSALMVRLRNPGPIRENPGTMMLATARDILAAVDLRACAARAPAATGELLMILRFPNTKRLPQAADPPPAITVELRGPPASTPLGACVQEGLNQAARSAPVPDFSGGSVSFRRTFPLQPDAGT